MKEKQHMIILIDAKDLLKPIPFYNKKYSAIKIRREIQHST